VETRLHDEIVKDEDLARVSGSTVASEPTAADELVHERVGRFMKLLPEVLNSERPQAVHDLRVCSRRLQQVLLTMFPKVPDNRAGSLVRTLRRARRGLSGWRDCDVLIALLDRRLRRLRNSDEQHAWQVVRAYLLKRRAKEIRRARHRLAKRKLFTLAQSTDDLLIERKQDTSIRVIPPDAFIAIVAEFIAASYTDWRAALAHATESGSQADAHYFRIKTKQLRYQIELARDLGDKEVLSQLNWLKKLQDSLGHCHDQVELARNATQAIANPEFLLSGPRSASLLLKRVARELLSEAARMKSLLAATMDSGELLPLEAWIDSSRADLEARRTNPSSA